MIGGIPEFTPDAPPFPGAIFGAAVSLGGNCEPAHWLRAFGRHAVRGPFDWLVTPLDALLAILGDDGARLGTVFALTNAGTSVRCQAYGALYHHEFPRDEGDAVVFDAPAMAACRSKLVHKWENLVAACARARGDGAPLLFMRLGGGTGLPWDRIGAAGAILRAADLNAIAAALTARFPDLGFRLLVLLRAPEEQTEAFDPDELDPRIAVRTLPQGSDPAWATDGATWGRLLASSRFRDPPTATTLGETLHWSGEVQGPTALARPSPAEVAGDAVAPI